MIHKLLVKDPKLAVIPWWEKVEALKDLPEIAFGEKLNILWGRNGSGKSTVLAALAKLTHCDQGGVSTVTAESIGELFPGFGGAPRFGLVLDHDAQAVLSLNAGKTYGLVGGAFDYDFVELGFQNTMMRGSSGQLQTHWLAKTIMDRLKWPEVVWKLRARGGDPAAPPPKPEEVTNDLWGDRVRLVREKCFSAAIPAGPKTILFDEPDRSLDLDAQFHLWRGLAVIAAQGFQVIVASHSAFASDVPGARYVELSPGYLDACRKLIGGKP